MRRKLSMPLSCKVFLTCAGLALFVSVVGSIALYRGATNSLREQVREQLKRVAATAALQVDADLHSQVRTRDDESSLQYGQIKDTLASIKNANPGMRYVYTMRQTGEMNTLQFVIDAETDPEEVSHVGDAYDVSRIPEMREAFAGPSADAEPTSDQWGTTLSGYAPIRDRSGRTVAIIGIDMSMDQLRAQEAGLRRAAVRNLLLALVVSVILSMLVTRSLLRPIYVFTRAAQRIRSGDLDCRVPVTGSVEVRQFAEAFNGMINGLKSSTRDFQTGLFNHMHFHERLSNEIERSERYGHSLCLLIMDLDRFKSINDTLGHTVGDSILRQFAATLHENLREADIPARYGGDEFVVILPETDRAAGLTLAERIRSVVESRPFSTAHTNETAVGDNDPKQSMRVTVTIGLAVYPDDHTTKDGLIMAADIALCRAKQISRNAVGSYDASKSGEEHVDPEELYRMLRDPNVAAIRSLAAAVDARDHYTSGHSERVADYAHRLAEAMGLDTETLDIVKVAGLLHDLGKIGVPDSILNKAAGLTQDERNLIQRHPAVGGGILQRAPQLDQMIPAIRAHHERFDGRGYPDNLAGDDIPLVARILAIADAFDAMTTDRPYRKAMSPHAALIELRASAGKQFDPDLVEAFISSMLPDQKKAA